MTNSQKDSLFALIKSLSKSEKRQFKLYVGRLGVNTESKFLMLFGLLDKMRQYDDAFILSKGFVKKQQLSNLKAHLYKQLLISLRLNPTHQSLRSQIREQLDFATILYRKGLYKQSLKTLNKAKSMALENAENNMAYEVVELEKIIEQQYITRSVGNRADQLATQAKELSKKNLVASKLSNLSLQLYNIMLKSGYVRNDKEFQQIKNYFEKRMPSFNFEELGFREKLWLYKAHLWFSFLSQDFLSCFKFANKYVTLFYENPSQINLNPVFFIKGNDYLLEALYLLKYRTKFKEVLLRLERTIHQHYFPDNDNLALLEFLCLSNNRLNLHFLEGSFAEGKVWIPKILKGIAQHQNRTDPHHVMVLYYKIACLYFGLGENKQCIVYLSKIINNRNLKMREDLMCFARVLSLVAHYESGMDYHLEIQLKSTYKFLLRMNNLQQVQREMIKFLKSLGNIYPHDLKNEFIKLHKQLKKYEDHPYERRAFLYLDIISWLESKIQNRPVGEIIKEKAVQLIR